MTWTHELLLDLPLPEDNDSGETTVRGYLLKLLHDLWEYEEGFNGKRPFGNSGWQADIYQAMVKAGMVPGTVDDDGYLDEFTQAAEDQADALILDAITSMR